MINISNILYKIWMCYFLFIKKVYRTRHKETNSAAFALSLGCLFGNLLFLMVILEKIFGFKGFIYILHKPHFPLAPIGIVGGFLIILPFVIVFNKKKMIDKYSIFRIAIINTRNVSMMYTISYLILSGLMLILEIIISGYR
jgi:hypothetical protein